MRRAALICLAALALASCGGPEVPDGVVISPDATEEERAALIAAAAELAEVQDGTAERTGLFARLFGRSDDPTPDVVAEAPEEVGVPGEVPEAGQPGRGGLFALFRRPEATKTDTAAPEEPRRALIAPNTEAPTAPVAGLPFGKAVVVCGLKRRDLGRQVDAYPSDGRALYRLYDTQSNSTGVRTQFITGLKGGCAVQVTGSLVIFGSPAAHEVHRYGAAMKGEPYTDTDKAFERIKAQVCGAPRGKPCTGGNARRLGQQVAFFTVYPRFGDTSQWLEVLLDDGRLAAQNLR